MAEIMGTIAKIALQIKEAVDTVHQNEKQCYTIARIVQTNSAILEVLVKETDITNVEAMQKALEEVKTTFEDALKLVKKCQNKHMFCRFFSAKDMANDLNQVLSDIGLMMQQATNCGVVHGAVVATRTYYATTTAPPLLPPPPREEEDDYMGFTRFRLSVLEEATNNFSNKIGVGGFSSVYKGVLHDGREVAIKKFYSSTLLNNYDMCFDEFTVGTKLQHKNVGSLLGYCAESYTRFMEHNGKLIAAQALTSILVLGYVPNGSLNDIVAGERHIDWSSCFKIIHQIAEGVQYIHQQRVIHLDLKPENILFDSDMTPVIIDFALSKVLENPDDDEIDLDDSIAGTYGYMAPEHFSGRVSLKSDVYAFGVTLLKTIQYTATGSNDSEIWQGREIWERMLEQAGGVKGLVNPTVLVVDESESQLTEINTCVEVGLRCIEANPAHRPPMADVVDMLSGKIKLPTTPEEHEKRVTKKVERSFTKKLERAFSKKQGRADSRT